MMSEIMQKIEKIMKERFNKDLSNYTESIVNEKLLGNKIGLEANELLYLYYDIEKEFSIRIPEKQIINGDFSTLNNIIGIIDSELKMKNI